MKISLDLFPSSQCALAGAGEAAGQRCGVDPGRVGGRSPRGDLPASSGGEDRLVPSSASRPRRRAATCPRAAGGPAFRAAIRGNDEEDRCREVSARGRAGRRRWFGAGSRVLQRWRLRRTTDGKQRRRRVPVRFQGGCERAQRRGQDRRLPIGQSAAS
jgi:hypothetical protein